MKWFRRLTRQGMTFAELALHAQTGLDGYVTVGVVIKRHIWKGEKREPTVEWTVYGEYVGAHNAQTPEEALAKALRRRDEINAEPVAAIPQAEALVDV